MPSDVAFEWTPTRSWRNQFACYDGDLVRRRGEKLSDVHAEFCEKVVRGAEQMHTEMLCPLGESMFIHRTRGEVHYLECLRAIPTELLNSWRGASTIDLAARVWSLAQWRIEFRCLRKTGPYWNTFCNNERHLPSKDVRAIPYQCLPTFRLGSEFFVAGLRV